MSILILFFSSLIFLLLPWWVGCQLRVITNNFIPTKSDINGAVRYGVDYAYGIVFITSIYIILLAINSPLSEFVIVYFGHLIMVIALIMTVIGELYKPGQVRLELGKMQVSHFDKLALIIVIFISGFAVLAHPYVYDSAQLQSIIKYTNSFNEFHEFDRGMVGYSSLILLAGTIFSDNPTPFIASAAKIPLGIIFLISIMNFAKYFRSLNYYYSVAILSVVLMSSSLGLYGYVTLGKDSIFGIAFMWLFFSLWLSREKGDDISKLDLVFVLLAAAMMGIITIPYVFLFFVVLALTRVFDHRLWSFTSLFFFVGIIPLSWLMSVVMGISPVSMAISLIIAALITGFAAKKFAIDNSNFGVPYWLISSIPIFSIAVLFLLLPLSGAVIDPEFNYQWPIPKPPLDGETTFLTGLLFARHSETLMSQYLFMIGWLGVALWAFTSKSPTVKGIAAMPFLVLLFSALHVNYDWHIIRFRLLWDLYKDIPQWTSGLYVGVGILAITSILIKYFRKDVVYVLFGGAIFFLALFPLERPLKIPIINHFFPVGTFNKVAGHNDKLMASVIEYNKNNPSLKFVLFQRGIWPGPLSFSRSFGYDSYLLKKQHAKISKKVISGEIGMVCYKVRKKELMLKSISDIGFTIIAKNIIRKPPFTCDKLLKD